MAQRFLVMGDHHGDTESLRRLLEDVETDRYALLERADGTDTTDPVLAAERYAY